MQSCRTSNLIPHISLRQCSLDFGPLAVWDVTVILIWQWSIYNPASSGSAAHTCELESELQELILNRLIDIKEHRTSILYQWQRLLSISHHFNPDRGAIRARDRIYCFCPTLDFGQLGPRQLCQLRVSMPKVLALFWGETFLLGFVSISSVTRDYF